MKVYTFIHCMVGATAMWAIRQNKDGNATPRNFLKLLNALHEKLHASETFKKTRVIASAYMFSLVDEKHLRDYLRATLESIPEFLELNLRQAEYDAGLRAADAKDDEKRNEWLRKKLNGNFGARYDERSLLKPEYEFIDLDALLRNITNTIMSEQEKASQVGATL